MYFFNFEKMPVFNFDDLDIEIYCKSLKYRPSYNIMLPSKYTDSLKSKGMQDLFKKEKELHKEIRKDYKKIGKKINSNFDQIQKSLTKK